MKRAGAGTLVTLLGAAVLFNSVDRGGRWSWRYCCVSRRIATGPLSLNTYAVAQMLD